MIHNTSAVGVVVEVLKQDDDDDMDAADVDEAWEEVHIQQAQPGGEVASCIGYYDSHLANAGVVDSTAGLQPFEELGVDDDSTECYGRDSLASWEGDRDYHHQLHYLQDLNS